jgi:hypothetical protein
VDDDPRGVPLELRRSRRHDPLRERRSPGGFKGVELNLAGWSALAGTGLVVGALAALAGLPPAVALPAGVIAAWAAALVVDHLRWRSRLTGMGAGNLDATSGRLIVARLEALGIEATYDELVDEWEGEVYTQRSIRCRNADAERVRAVMDEVCSGANGPRR